MRLPKFSVSSLSIVGIVLLVGGLGVAVLGAQQVQENRSRASLDGGGGGSTGVVKLAIQCEVSPPYMYVHRGNNVTRETLPTTFRSTYCPYQAGPGVARYIDCTNQSLLNAGIGKPSNSFADVDRRLCALYTSTTQTPPTTNDCETPAVGGTCVGASSQGVGQCPDGKSLTTAISCGSMYRICCKPTSTQPSYIGQSCKSGSGTCQDKNVSGSCSGGSFYAGYCPGGSNIQCCVRGGSGGTQTGTECGRDGCCSQKISGAKCQYTSQACPGGFVPTTTWYCPRGNDYRCCKPAPATDTTAPSASALTATAVSTSEIALSWTKSTDNVGIKNYTIFRDGQQVAVATAGATTYQDKNLNQETRYKYTVDANDAANNKTKSNEAFATTEKAIVPDTIFSMELLMHGIGKSGDNRNKHGQGNTNPNTKKRNIVVQLFDPNTNQPILTKDGKVDYDSESGSFKLATLNMGNTLETKTYIIRVNSQSLRGKVTRDITAGETNVIPVMTLINGDANWDGKLDIEDYHLINGCIRDFDLPPADCDGPRAQKADLDDDGTVGIFDLNLFIRELSVQEL